MSVRVLTPAAGGSAYLYHTSINPDGSTNEHFFIGRVRQGEKVNITYCHLCDATSYIPRGGGDDHARAVDDYIAKGRITPVALGDTIDPLQWAKEDLVDASLVHVPTPTPQDTEGRKRAREDLKTSHSNVKP